MEETRPVLMSDESQGDMRKSFKGIFLASLSALVGTITLVAVKLITEVSTSQKTLFNYSQTSVYSLIIILTMRDFYPFIPKDLESVLETIPSSHQQQQVENDESYLKSILFLLLGAFTDSTATFLYYSALQQLEIGDANVVRLSTTFFVYLLAKIFLGELIGLFNALMLLISVVGIALVSKVKFIFGGNNNRLDFDESHYHRLWPTFLVILACFLFSITAIIWRKVCKVY
jgi:drug/metabolite transporter (DMT)-like permease